MANWAEMPIWEIKTKLLQLQERNSLVKVLKYVLMK